MSDSELETSELLGNTSTTMEARHDHQLAKRFKLLHILSIVLGLILILLVFVWVFHFQGGVAWSSNPKIEFNWHPLLMTIGFIFLYAQSMLIYRVGRYSSKRTLKLIHASVHMIVFIITVVALKAVFDMHNLLGYPNLYSLHSWIGLITVILFSCQYVAGFVTYLYPGLSLELRGAYMHVHTSFGTAGFVLALLTAVMGIMEKATFNPNYSKMGPDAVLINFIGLFLVGFGALVLYLVNESSYKRIPLPEDNMLLTSSPVHTENN